MSESTVNFVSDSNKIATVYPSSFWKDTMIGDKARTAFRAHVDRVFDQSESELANSGFVRRSFIEATEKFELRPVVWPVVNRFVRANAGTGSHLIHQNHLDIREKLIDSLWSLWKDETPEQS